MTLTAQAPFLTALKADPTYRSIDLDAELAKFTRWCRSHGRPTSQRLFVSWLKRVDRPIPDSPPTPTFRHKGRYCECAPGAPDPECLAVTNGAQP